MKDLAFYACTAILLGLWASHAQFVSWADSRSRARAIPLQRPLETLPASFAQWRGRTTRLPDDVVQAAEADQHICRTYYDSAGRAVTLYVTYYGGLYRNIPHGPATCYPMSGWKMLDSQLLADATGAQHQKFIFSKQLEKHLVLYWYYLNGARLVGESSTRMSYAARLLRGAGGSIVQVQITANAHRDADAAHEHAEAFRKTLEPLLHEIIPDTTTAQHTETVPEAG